MSLSACMLPDKQIGDGGATESGDGDGDGDGDLDSDTESDSDTDGGWDGDDCNGPFSSLAVDRDCDGVGLVCDNAPGYHNPNQLDQDGDGFGDGIDLCPLLASDTNTADSDRDGIGDVCDLCPRPPSEYNASLAPGVDSRLWVRNIPTNADVDNDGIGDACDNCVAVPNCDEADPDACQLDTNGDGIGDACEGVMLPGAAGVVGFGPEDDFDQDGLANLIDGCPRLPVAAIACEDDGPCPMGASCAATGICTHADIDGDGVGDECDTCPILANPPDLRGRAPSGLSERRSESSSISAPAQGALARFAVEDAGRLQPARRRRSHSRTPLSIPNSNNTINASSRQRGS